jgi:DNA polymerase III epsilon subunit family exonuclease
MAPRSPAQPGYRRPKKSPLWLPYLQSIKETKRGIFEFVFNGGEETVPADQILSIMVYGTSDTALDPRILTKLCGRGIPIVIHRRTVERSIYIASGPRADPDDTLSAHLIKRSQSRAATHVARQLLKAKMSSMSWLVEPKNLPQYADIDKLRNIEAVHAKGYWDAWFERIGHPQWHRRSKNPASEALDAVSKFCSGITLRWITYHNLSPFHGFLHTPTDYPTLIYDLLEPYRGLVDFIVLRTILATEDEKKWVPYCIAAVKSWLSTQTYVPLTRQIATNQELFHGIVLSLKFYVLGRQRIFHVPLPGKPQGGRPAKVEFKLYGRHAGKTDFWSEAARVSSSPLDIETAISDAVKLSASPATTATAAPHQPAAAKSATGRTLKATPALPADYCVIDVETTGVVSSHDSIIEIAALKVRNRQVADSFQTLIRTSTPLNETIREMTGLTNDILSKSGIDLGDALERFTDFVGDDLLAGHNVNFDIRFVNQALYTLKQTQLVNASLNVIPIARKMLPGRSSYKLRDLATDLGIEAATSHRALADCLTTQAVLTALYTPPSLFVQQQSAATVGTATGKSPEK